MRIRPFGTNRTPKLSDKNLEVLSSCWQASKCLKTWRKWTDLSPSSSCFEQEVLFSLISEFDVWLRNIAPTSCRVRRNEWIVSWEGSGNEKVKIPLWQVPYNSIPCLGNKDLKSPLTSGMPGSRSSIVSGPVFSLFFFYKTLYRKALPKRCHWQLHV